MDIRTFTSVGQVSNLPPRDTCGRRGIGLALLLLLLACQFLIVPTPAIAAAAARKRGQDLLMQRSCPLFRAGAPQCPQSCPLATVHGSLFLVADGWNLRRFLGSAEAALSDRRRMIQLATIGMCIGLYILMRK